MKLLNRLGALALVALVSFGAVVSPAAAQQRTIFEELFNFDRMDRPMRADRPTRSGQRANRVSSEFQRQVVRVSSKEKAGTIIVNTKEHFLYFMQGDGTAIRYGVGVGREGFEWSGTNKVSRKAEWPGWTPPAEMRKRQPGLPAYMPGGPDNPLGARALYIGSTLYRIHGTNEPWSIGQSMSSGCIRMLNEDVMDLYERVKIGAKVVVI